MFKLQKFRKKEDTMIKNIIFDIGNVLAKFRWEEYIEDFGFTKEINERLAKATVLSYVWNEVDRGELSMDKLIQLCIENDPEIEEEIRIFFQDRSSLVIEFDYSEGLVRELKEKGYHIYLLSNYGKENFAIVKNIFKFIPYVDGAVISYEIKKIKPEPEIYKALLEKYNIISEESVFLDDIETNIKAAQAFGINTIHFHDLKQAKEELRASGVDIS